MQVFYFILLVRRALGLCLGLPPDTIVPGWLKRGWEAGDAAGQVVLDLRTFDWQVSKVRIPLLGLEDSGYPTDVSVLCNSEVVSNVKLEMLKEYWGNFTPKIVNTPISPD